MHRPGLSSLVALLCVAILAFGAGLSVGRMTGRPRPGTPAPGASPRPEKGGAKVSAAPATFELIAEGFEDGGFGVASKYATPVLDPGSLAELRESVRDRGKRGIAALQAQYDALRLDSPPTREQLLAKVAVLEPLGLVEMYQGDFAAAAARVGEALTAANRAKAPPATRSKLTALMGIIALRRGEIDNCVGCVGPSSCIFPIERAAVHKNQEGSREAVRWFTDYLKEWPGDLRVVWLLNIAYMTLGEYPEGVPPAVRVPVERFLSKADVGRFPNVASRAGLGARGPNLAGGSVFDDFSGDGLPDLFTTSLNADRGASLFVNRGDGTFEDRSASAGLDGQVYALNVTRTDYNNDGRLDVLLLRGGWESPARLSLLKNRGDETFDDVTVASGLGEPISSEAAAWGDYDNDGHLDLYVCGEYLPPGGSPLGAEPDGRNRGRLYRNRGDGTFQDVAPAAGVVNLRCGKGAAWGDYDADGRLDLFVSNMGQPCRLYHNEGGGKFRDVAPALGVTGPAMSFACWFWDYDNDGRLDLYVNDYGAKSVEVLAGTLGLSPAGAHAPRLYRNLGRDGFRDVTHDVGLDRAMAPMGANFGDVDNDGYLDLYLGTGDMSYSGLDLNLMFKNTGGTHFENVTNSSGTGHLQKGHGVSFADFNADGAPDLFVELGGATPGDQAHNALFQNPGQGRHWLKVKLAGVRTNRAAIGASLRAVIRGPDGSTRTVYRTVGNNSSFGGNTLVETVGLLDATGVAELTVTWPTGGTTQTFRDLAADQEVEITEGRDAIKTTLTVGPAPR